jgi:hypothetical protein
MATLEQFLRTGELGPLHVGMREAEVIALLGAPQDESVSRKPRILKYGGLQLAFRRRPGAMDGELTFIGLYFSPGAEPIPEPSRPTDFNGSANTTVVDVRAFFAKANLLDLVIKEGENLVMASGATIAFEDQILHSIQFAAPVGKRAIKQLSVSISNETLNQLMAVAKQSNRSVSELCAEWITQQANKLQHATAEGVDNRR